MFKKTSTGPPLLVILDINHRQQILQVAHRRLGHRGVYGVHHYLKERFFWPHLYQDVKHHVSTCHQCQLRSTQYVKIPSTIRQLQKSL